MFAKLVVCALVLLASSMIHAAERNVPNDYKTIQAAINASLAGDTVLVEPGTYGETITLHSNTVLRGRETARTLLKGNGEDPVIIADGVTDVRISNFTFIDASVGVRVSGSADIIIASNVFNTGRSGTAVVVMDSAAAEINNNTFFENGTAVDRAHNGVRIRNNLFYENNTAIAPAGLVENISYNGFRDNDDNGPVGNDPMLTKYFKFISIDKRDFHLRFSSGGRDEGDENDTDVIDGTRADMGAYGGAYADVFPFPVSGLSAEQSGEDSIVLKWSINPAYMVAGYKLYYGSDSSLQGNDAAEGVSPIELSKIELGSVTSYTLTGLSPIIPPALDAPQLEKPAPSNQVLQLGWSPVSGASGYTVYYGVDSADEQKKDVGNSTSYRITGLRNEVGYKVMVSAYSRSAYHFAISAYDSTSARNESVRIDGSRITAGVGSILDGPLSNTVSAFPEALEPYPNLPDEGCFVATAAYGYYSAPQVQLLRDFRDRYLLSNFGGRAFVSWYYTYGPAAAQWLDSHPQARPMVRAALFPVIVVADFVLNGSVFYKAGLMLLCIILGTMLALHRKPALAQGGR